MNFADEDFELKEVQRLEGHTGKVLNIAWKPTGAVAPAGVPAVLASCGEDNTVRIWEKNPSTRSFQCKAILNGTHTAAVRSLAWSPCGKLLATASCDTTAAIWKEIGGVFSRVAILEGHEKEVQSVAWNATSTLVATCGRDNRVFIWELQRSSDWDNDQFSGNIDFELFSVLKANINDVEIVLWHQSVDFLFACSCDSTIKIFKEEDLDTNIWRCIQILDKSASGHTSKVWALSFNGIGDKMVSCSDDLTVKIWGCHEMERTVCGDGITDWKHLRTFHGFHYQTVHWSREGLISTGSADGDICLFVGMKDESVDNEDDSVDDASTYRFLLRKEKAHEMGVNAVQWSTMENRCLASASDGVGAVKIWELCSSNRNKKLKRV